MQNSEGETKENIWKYRNKGQILEENIARRGGIKVKRKEEGHDCFMYNFQQYKSTIVDHNDVVLFISIFEISFY